MSCAGLNLALAGASIMTACTEPGDLSVHAVVTDSAGVRIVTFSDVQSDLAPTLATKELLNTARIGLDLHKVVGVRLMADGSLVVGNAGFHEIIHLSPEGEVLRRFGRPGDGPGEFRDMTSVEVSSSPARIVAYDAETARLTEFHLDGDSVATRPLSPESPVVDLVPLAYSWADSVVLAVFGAQWRFAQTGVRRDSTPLLRIGIASGVLDTVGLWGAKEWAYLSYDGGAARAPIAFSRDVAYSGRDGQAVIGSTEGIDLAIVDVVGGESWRLRVSLPEVPIDESTVRDWKADAHRRFENGPPPLRDLVLDHVPETYPAFDGVVIDDRGRVWVGLYPIEGSATRNWLVFTPTGEFAGVLRLPSTAEVVEAAYGRVVAKDRTAMGEEYLRVLEFR